MQTDRKIGVDGSSLRDRSRAAPLTIFELRQLVYRDGAWYCAVEGCGRTTVPFPNSRSAKSHPYAAHGIPSPFSGSMQRRDRRYRSAPLASTATQLRVEEFLAPFGLPPHNIPELQRRHLRNLILERLSIPSDAPPPCDIPGIEGIVPLGKWRAEKLNRGEEEHLRRTFLYAVWCFAARTGANPAAVVDVLGVMVDRRFYPRGAPTDVSGEKPSMWDGLADLFSRNARRA